MGVLWEIVQTRLTYGQKRKSDCVEDRVQALEDQLQLTWCSVHAKASGIAFSVLFGHLL